MTSDAMYYVQDKSRGYLGNSPVWWALNDQGYTAYILGAKRFTYDAALVTVNHADDLAMYPCDEIDKRLHLIFDSQDFHRLGTDEPCGWKGGYASRTPDTSAKPTCDNANCVKRGEGQLEAMGTSAVELVRELVERLNNIKLAIGNWLPDNPDFAQHTQIYISETTGIAEQWLKKQGGVDV